MDGQPSSDGSGVKSESGEDMEEEDEAGAVGIDEHDMLLQAMRFDYILENPAASEVDENRIVHADEKTLRLKQPKADGRRYGFKVISSDAEEKKGILSRISSVF